MSARGSVHTPQAGTVERVDREAQRRRKGRFPYVPSPADLLRGQPGVGQRKVPGGWYGFTGSEPSEVAEQSEGAERWRA